MSQAVEAEVAPIVSSERPACRTYRRRFVWFALLAVVLLFLFFLLKDPSDRDAAVINGIEDRGGRIYRDQPLLTRLLDTYVLKRRRDLKRGSPFQAVVLNPTNEELEVIGRARSICYLGLKGRKVDDEVLKTLTALPRLISLTLLDTQMTDTDLERIVTSLKRPHELLHLTLRGTSLTDQGLNILAKCTALNSIEIDGSNIDGKSLSPLSKLKLRRLKLDHSNVGDEGVTSIIQQWGGSLRSIQLAGNPVTDQGINQLSGAPGIYDLGIGGTKATPEGMRLLLSRQTIGAANLSDLSWKVEDLGLFNLDWNLMRYLKLAGWNIGDAELKSLPAMPCIISLDLSRTGITDDGVEELARFPTLRILYLDGTSISLKGFAKIQKVLKLSHVSLGGTEISYQDLIDMPFPLPFENVILNGMDLTDEQLHELQRKHPGCNFEADDRFAVPQ